MFNTWFDYYSLNIHFYTYVLYTCMRFEKKSFNARIGKFDFTTIHSEPHICMYQNYFSRNAYSTQVLENTCFLCTLIRVL